MKHLLLIILSFLLINLKPYAFANQNVSLEEKIGQMIIVGFKSHKVSREVKQYIQKYHIGGVILFNKSAKNNNDNIKDTKQLKTLITNLQAISKTPLFISIDQEGGYVARLKEQHNFKTQIPTAEKLSWRNNKFVKEYSYNLASELKDIGINLNYAPVVDVNINPDSPAIGRHERSFSADVNKVIEKASIFIEGHHEANLITSIKHFPGHGSSTDDSHLDFVDITEVYQQIELKPYENLLKSGYNDTVMIGHLINRNIDEKYPSSLSYSFVTEILRNKMNYNGVVITDDLKMGAIENNYSLEETIVQVINSGVDIILYSNHIGKYNKTFVKDTVEIIKKNIENGTISEDRINESYERIMDLKKRYIIK